MLIGWHLGVESVVGSLIFWHFRNVENSENSMMLKVKKVETRN
jgi:hypothetical protein